MDIGQWPRLILAVSGLVSGVLFDYGKGRYRNLIMYCVTLLSTVCILVIVSGGSFLLGLIVFYLSAGFFVVFFSTGFVRLRLAKLEKEGKLKAVITQNIDGLHQAAGSKNVFELHGSTLRNYCTGCGAFYDVDFIANSTGVPRCPKCGGIVKPDVVLYEEGLDEEVLSGAVQAIRKADTLIIGGTSLVVYPAAGLIRYFRGRHLVVINMQPTGADAQADLCIAKPIGQVLSEDITVG